MRTFAESSSEALRDIYVCITHAGGTQTYYLHLSKTLVNEGDQVSAGTPIGAVGNTGRSHGAHLHFSVEVDGESVDPIAFTRARGLDLCPLSNTENAIIENAYKYGAQHDPETNPPRPGADRSVGAGGVLGQPSGQACPIVNDRRAR